MTADLITILSSTDVSRRELGEHRFTQLRTENPSDLKKYILREARKYDFELPNNPFVLFYTLGDPDFDEAQLWSPFMRSDNCSQNNVLRNLRPDISLEEIRAVSKAVSREYEVLEVYGSERFALPRFREYANGVAVRESPVVGSEEYRASFREQDRERFRELFTEQLNHI